MKVCSENVNIASMHSSCAGVKKETEIRRKLWVNLRGIKRENLNLNYDKSFELFVFFLSFFLSFSALIYLFLRIHFLVLLSDL